MPGDAAGDPVHIKGIIVVFDQVIEFGSLSRNLVKLCLSRHGKTVLDLKTSILVQHTVLFKTRKKPFVVNMEKFHMINLLRL